MSSQQMLTDVSQTLRRYLAYLWSQYTGEQLQADVSGHKGALNNRVGVLHLAWAAEVGKLAIRAQTFINPNYIFKGQTI